MVADGDVATVSIVGVLEVFLASLVDWSMWAVFCKWRCTRYKTNAVEPPRLSKCPRIRPRNVSLAI
jgi:hypothetical protein